MECLDGGARGGGKVECCSEREVGCDDCVCCGVAWYREVGGEVESKVKGLRRE